MPAPSDDERRLRELYPFIPANAEADIWVERGPRGRTLHGTFEWIQQFDPEKYGPFSDAVLEVVVYVPDEQETS